ncbi:MAG TPA: NUDIX domain-containing protein [Verrucomicrobiota bacterium]|nr:NUDIX domain-containing protein [Verrucomicrobiota bacterium]
MQEELFDIVNERDEVIGQRPRSEVHRLGLMHRSVHVLVFNAAGQVYLQKRSMKKDRQPGLWDSSASGHVAAGEDYDACAIRELGEEIGLKVAAAPQRLFKLAASAETDQEHVWVYRCKAEGPFRLDAEEIERGGWFSPGRVTSWMAERPQDFAGALLAIWNRVGHEARFASANRPPRRG